MIIFCRCGLDLFNLLPSLPSLSNVFLQVKNLFSLLKRLYCNMYNKLNYSSDSNTNGKKPFLLYQYLYLFLFYSSVFEFLVLKFSKKLFGQSPQPLKKSLVCRKWRSCKRCYFSKGLFQLELGFKKNLWFYFPELGKSCHLVLDFVVQFHYYF